MKELREREIISVDLRRSCFHDSGVYVMIHGAGLSGAECETAGTLGETQYELQNHLVHVPSNVLRVERA